jgi:uncharacterized damage-inducible protein DinB
MDRQAIIKGIRESNHLLAKSCEAVPADKFEWAPGEAGTTLKWIVAHCAAMPKWVIAAVEARGWTDEFEEPQIRSLSEGLALLESNSAELIAFIEAFLEAQAGDVCKFPWGEQTVAETFGLLYWHNTYHLGQVNYIQLLLGDREFHV